MRPRSHPEPSFETPRYGAAPQDAGGGAARGGGAKNALAFSRRVFRLSFTSSCPSFLREGAGKAGRRLRPQHRVQWVVRTHTGLTGTAETSRLSPRNGLRLIRTLPGEAAFLAPVAAWALPAA